MLNLWAVYDYLAHRVHAYMVDHDECLYNALVRTMSRRADSKLSREQMMRIRDSALELAEFINQEILDRDTELCATCGEPHNHESECPVAIGEREDDYSIPDSLESSL